MTEVVSVRVLVPNCVIVRKWKPVRLLADTPESVGSTSVTTFYYEPAYVVGLVLFFDDFGREMYTTNMNEFMNNRYVQLAGLMLGLGTMFYLLLWILLSVTRLDIPWFVPVIISFGGAIWLVWKFFAYKIG